MQTDIRLRNDMMAQSKAIIDAASVKVIEILDSGNTLLCSIPFLSYEKKAGTGSSSTYEFIGIDGTTSLKAGVTTPGSAAKFRIYGDFSGGDEVVFNGSVGTTSNFDFTFNSVAWNASTFVTLTNVNISIRHGS